MARKARGPPKRKKAARRSTLQSVPRRPNPRAWRSVTPYLVIDGTAEAIAFYKKAFGAKEIDRSALPDGSIMHATIQIGDSLIMMSDEFPGSDTKSPRSAGATTFNLHLYTKDADALWSKAIHAGATPTMPLENQFWGERYGKLRDPFGHVWSVSMVVQMSEAEKEAKRQAAFAMFEKGDHPGFESA